MPTTIAPVITNAGLAAAIAADGLGVDLELTHVALGTGQYTPANPNSQTAMVARTEKVTISGGRVSGTGACRMDVVFPSFGGTPYNATELGFWAGDPDAGGVLFAVWSHPSDVIVNRNALDYVASFALQLSRVPPGSVTVTVDTGAAQALSYVAAHEGAANPHPQYVRHDTGAQALSASGKANGRRNLGFDSSTDVASAGTIDVFAAGTYKVRVTGSVTINRLDDDSDGSFAAAHQLRLLEFAANCAVNYSSAYVLTQGNRNMAVKAGDRLLVEADGTGKVTVIDWFKRDGDMFPGFIGMFSGAVANIPSGWQLCDGTNGTPDLRSKFIVGASASGGYAVGAQGGSADAVVVSHSHTATTGNQSADHTHGFSGTTASAGDHAHTTVVHSNPGQATNTGTEAAGGIWQSGATTYNPSTSTAGAHTHGFSGTTAGASANHNHAVTVNSAGVSGTNANLPPYYALAFIMKL